MTAAVMLVMAPPAAAQTVTCEQVMALLAAGDVVLDLQAQQVGTLGRSTTNETWLEYQRRQVEVGAAQVDYLKARFAVLLNCASS